MICLALLIHWIPHSIDHHGHGPLDLRVGPGGVRCGDLGHDTDSDFEGLMLPRNATGPDFSSPLTPQ